MYCRILKYFDYMLDKHFLLVCCGGLLFVVILWTVVYIKSKGGGDNE